MLAVKVALAVGLMLIATAIGLVLSRSPLTVVATNSIPAHPHITQIDGGGGGCEQIGTLPPDTSAIRISAAAKIGPEVKLKVLSGRSVLTQGRRDAGWGTAETVTVPVKPLDRAIADAAICIAFGPIAEPVQISGAIEQTVGAGGRVARVARFRAEYLRPGRRSWWSLALSVARRMGLGHAPAGSWIVILVLALMIAVATLAVRLVLVAVASGGRSASEASQAVGRVPRAAWTCAAIACLNAACWSVITPPFQAPDEPAHFAYVQQIAENGRLPTSPYSEYSQEEEVALRDLHHLEVRWHPERQPITTLAQQRHLEADLARPLARSGPGGAGVASSEPPLYYALQTIPYGLGSDGSLLDRLELMRLLSALMAGVTALFAYLFVREALPGSAWAWAIGGLGVALTPLLAFISGTVNPDAMLFAVSAAVFYLLARAFRHGLTRRRAVAIGVVTAIGLLTKLNFIGLVPGVVGGLVVLSLRARGAARRAALTSLALALAIAATPVCVYIVVNLLLHHRTLGIVSDTVQRTSRHGSVLEEIGYIWQLYLPRLPAMARDFPGISPLRQIWFDRSVGFYGWLDTSFPTWVDNRALIPAAVLAGLVLRALLRARVTLQHRLVELASYAIMGVGVLALVGADSYIAFPAQAGSYGEPRYFLTMLAPLGAALALAARGAGRRWGPVAGALIVVVFLAHDVFSQLLVVARFYG